MNVMSKLAIPVILTSMLTQHAWAEDATTHDVIVVGAGAAGMEAARVAAADGHSVLIIEAKDYIGGRVRTITVGQTRLEGGAEEHYPNYETTNAIQSHYGNNVYGAGYEGAEVYGLDGGSNTCWSEVNPTTEIACGNDIGGTDEIEDDFWKETCQGTEHIESWIAREYGSVPGDRLWHLYAASYFEGVYAGSPIHIGCQAQINAGYSWSLSENDIKAIVPYNLGYTDAMKTLYWDATLANAKVDHFLSTPVIKIEDLSDGDGDYVEVTTATGGVHTAWRVIVTVSIGVLQDEIIDFVPDLPTATVNAYNDMGFDDGFKIAMQFSRDENGDAFWESEGIVGWMAFPGTIGACWVPTNYKSGYSGEKDAILMCYPMGDNGTALNNTAIAAGGGAAGEAAVVAELLAQLDVMFPNQLGEASATYTGDNFVQNWGGDPYTSGVYSFETTTSWQNMGQNKATSRNTIRAPHYDDKLFFAGEGTNRGNGATVPGARQEGARAANEVDSSNMPNGLPPIKGPDETAPVVTLNGNTSISIYQYSTFTDQGATALDDRDGDISGSIVVNNSVNTNVPGTYTVTYTVSDAAGNSAVATRTVSVMMDTVAPVITLNGSDTLSIVQFTSFTDPGATASDNVDGNITSSIVVSGSVNADTLGTYELTYSVNDAAGNSDSATLTVTVSEYVDTVAPVITLIGNSSVNLDFDEAYVEQGATASDNDDGNITANIGITGTVNSGASGTYTINYSVYDAAGNEGTATRSVTVGPEPGVTLIPTKSVFAPGEAIGIEYTEGTGSNKDWIGLYPADNLPADGDGGSAEANLVGWKYTNGSAGTITNWDNYSALPEGDYVAILFSNDSYNFYGEKGYFSVGTVTGPDETAPVITLNGGSVTLDLNEAYVEAGATASDDTDGDISASIQISGSVDSSTVGTYTITYSVSDAAGNSASTTRSVTVNDGVVDPDTVIVGSVIYLQSKGRLVIIARSSDGTDVELTVEGYGVMDTIHPNKPDRYRMFLYLDQADVPSSVTVTSENGGTFTKNVTIK